MENVDMKEKFIENACNLIKKVTKNNQQNIKFIMYGPNVNKVAKYINENPINGFKTKKVNNEND